MAVRCCYSAASVTFFGDYVERCNDDATMNIGHRRFQVSMLSVNIVLPPRIFSNTDDMDKVRPAYADEREAKVGTIVD